MAIDAVQCNCFASGRPVEFIRTVCTIYFSDVYFYCSVLLHMVLSYYKKYAEPALGLRQEREIMKCNHYLMDTWKMSHLSQMPSTRLNHYHDTLHMILSVITTSVYFSYTKILGRMASLHPWPLIRRYTTAIMKISNWELCGYFCCYHKQ